MKYQRVWYIALSMYRMVQNVMYALVYKIVRLPDKI